MFIYGRIYGGVPKFAHSFMFITLLKNSALIDFTHFCFANKEHAVCICVNSFRGAMQYSIYYVNM